MSRYRKLFPNEKLGTGMEEKGSMMNRTIKAAVGMVAIAAMSVGTLAACGGSSSSSDNGKGKVYFLNFKPESSDEWKKLAKDYTCLLYTSPSPRDGLLSRMPSSA